MAPGPTIGFVCLPRLLSTILRVKRLCQQCTKRGKPVAWPSNATSMCIVSTQSQCPATADGDKSHQERRHHCNFCDYKTDKMSSFKDHIRVHTGERPFACNLCPQRFSQRSALKEHLRVHTGERSFQCPSCCQKFKQKVNLKQHLRVHTGEKPFQCPSCPRHFTQKVVLKQHLRIHTGERPFQCHLCPQTFARRSYLNTHLSHHKRTNGTSEHRHGRWCSCKQRLHRAPA
ncbi:uncharacterized protein LOC142579925 [Dermacentor variabilis]|uniref:uncharacterized protein LOC142579925 n=1 Tax=Dermacentor variabilis TaxID=34621 RepID=UPI003F5BA9E4